MARTKYNPKVSVITAVYNGERYLAEAIESVLAQTFTDFEYIIVDDGSTDNTPEIIEEFILRDSRISTVRIENSGPANARNVALQMAKADWIAVLDADDICLPYRLEEQVKFVKEHPECNLVGSGCVEITADGTVIKEHHYPCDHGKLVKNLEKHAKFFPHSSNFYRRMLGGTAVRYNTRYIRSQDYDLWLMLSELGRIGCVDKILIKLRRHASSISDTGSGNVQVLMGMSAQICHFRRKVGLSDPSQMDEDVWQDFLKWVEKTMDEEAYFQQMQGWQVLRNAWYSNLGVNKLKRGKLVLKVLTQNPLARRALWRRVRKVNLALRLMEDSRKLWKK